MRFGKIDDLISRVAAAIDGARNCLFSEQHEEGYWCGELEADATLEADYIILHVLLGTGNPERMAKAARYILQHQNEDGGWSIYCRRPIEYQRLGQVLFRAEAGGLCRRPSGAGARPQEDSGNGRGHRGQYLYQDLSLLLRAVRLRRGAGDPAGNRSVSQVVLVQHLRDFVLVAGHPGAAVDLLRQEAVQEDSRRIGRGRAVRRRARQVAHAFALGQEAVFLA